MADTKPDVKNLMVDPRHVVEALADEYTQIVAGLVQQNAQYRVALTNLTTTVKELEAKVAALITGPVQKPVPAPAASAAATRP